ncbi:PKD domain-containing protein [Anaeromyxobacter sp. PSR-1]|uniref:PKD domain-containing protein n=1 Tax=Anaeromyxobacter sp. PSR-1 TaxID=1300915 RepID=UPI0005E536D5|nr:PKD domain-containing protein [Anaeromyxobacter sp. PSR-1]GAO04596.1 dyslexia-associated protein KIAA0319-like protein [Anaeromyxobacter sp. PSR-1]
MHPARRRTAAALALCTALACSGGSDKPSLPVIPGNGPPVAQAGFDRTVGKGALVQLDGAASSDPEGFPLTYGWTFTSRPGGSAALIQSAGSAHASFTADVPGVYGVRLQVSDGVNPPVSDDVVITSQDLPPTASIGPDREGSRGIAVALDGRASADPDGDALTYAWALVSRPAGSAAAFGGATLSQASFTPDVYGAYVVRLTVTAGGLSAQDEATITVRNHAPVADAGPDLESNAGATLALSAAASSDPDQDPITCAWALVSKPTGSAAALSDPAACAPSVTYDLEGVYAFSLAVHDGELASAATDVVQVTVHRKVWMLGHAVVDAEYSRALDRLVAVGGSKLYVADPVAGTEVSVALPKAALAVSVSPDGRYAAVGHDALVSYVSLDAPPALVGTFTTSVVPSDVVLAGNGYIYVFPATWEQLHSIRISTGADTASTGWSPYDGTKGRLHPGGAAIYGADNFVSPEDIRKFSIAGGTASFLYDSPYHGDYEMCGDLWITEDGLRIVTACGNTFHANTTQGSTAGSDMTYAGALEGTGQVKWADHSAAAGQILVVRGLPYWPADPGADAELRLFGDDFLALQETIPLARIGVGGKGYVSHGRFAFFSADATRRVALVQVDATSGLLAPDAVVVY